MFKKIAILAGSVLVAGSVFADAPPSPSTLETLTSNVLNFFSTFGVTLLVILDICMAIVCAFFTYKWTVKSLDNL